VTFQWAAESFVLLRPLIIIVKASPSSSQTRLFGRWGVGFFRKFIQGFDATEEIGWNPIRELIWLHARWIVSIFNGAFGLIDQQCGFKVGTENIIFREVDGHIAEINLHRLVIIAFGDKWQQK
jgi:hypothetical protein